MALYIKFTPTLTAAENFPQYLKRVQALGYKGIYFNLSDINATKTVLVDREILRKVIKQTKKQGLKTALIVKGFYNESLYRNEYFTAPMSRQGVSYVPKMNYFPICPNNPIGLKLLISNLNEYLSEFSTDHIYLEHFQFPFNWMVEDLDIQDKIPQFCYCPFCITEFSSMVGEIITSGEQIHDLMTEWLEWRVEVILDLISELRAELSKQVQLTIALPPLAIIDLSFSTGQLPHNLIEEGVNISPQLYHLKANKKLIWIEDILDQYKIDLNYRKIFPIFEYNNQTEFNYLVQFENQFGGLILQPGPDII